MATVINPSEQLEQKVIRPGVSWETYERLLADFENSSSTRFAYDRGVLEIMLLSAKHEAPNRAISLLVEIVASEMGIGVVNFGSTTFKREDLARGFEPDTSFYIGNADRIRGKDEIDLTADPPPDLVIEIDITHPSLDKMPIYAAIGVPEIWVYDGNRVVIHRLTDGEYATADESRALPGLESNQLSRFMEESKSMKRTEWTRSVIEWAKSRNRSGDCSR